MKTDMEKNAQMCHAVWYSWYVSSPGSPALTKNTIAMTPYTNDSKLAKVMFVSLFMTM